MTAGAPPADIAIDADLARRLLQAQFPDLADLPLTPVGEGWDNALFRLGEHLVLRLPRRAAAVPYLCNEQDWLPALAPWLPIRTPVPVRLGKPTDVYPWRWTLAAWTEGACADQEAPDDAEAVRLAACLRALHRPAPAAAPINEARGVPLQARQAGVEDRLARLRRETNAITPEIDVIWAQALSVPAAAERVWLHGDLHPRNVLTQRGAIAAIIDWGDLCAGDPATDLAAFWMLFGDNDARAEGIEAYGADAHLVARAKGWAVLFGAVLLDSGRVNDPRHAAVGAETLRRLTRCPI